MITRLATKVEYFAYTPNKIGLELWLALGLLSLLVNNFIRKNIFHNYW